MIIVKHDSKQLTKNFNSNEFDCKCDNCIETLIHLPHVIKLQELRDKIKKPIHINSGYRCKDHNRAIGGTPGSQHTLGTATDVVVKGLSIPELFFIADQMDFNGIGLYDTFIHLDSRLGNRTRWDLRTNITIKA